MFQHRKLAKLKLNQILFQLFIFLLLHLNIYSYNKIVITEVLLKQEIFTLLYPLFYYIKITDFGYSNCLELFIYSQLTSQINSPNNSQSVFKKQAKTDQ